MERPPSGSCLTAGSSSGALGQIAGDRLEKIGARDDPLEAAVLVDHDRELERRALEELEHVEDRGARGRRHRLAHDLIELEAPRPRGTAQHVFLARDSEQLVDRPAPDRKFAVAARAQASRGRHRVPPTASIHSTSERWVMIAVTGRRESSSTPRTMRRSSGVKTSSFGACAVASAVSAASAPGARQRHAAKESQDGVRHALTRRYRLRRACGGCVARSG